MNRYCLGLMAPVVALMFLSSAAADTLQVDTSTATPISSAPLIKGQLYQVEVTGTYYFGYDFYGPKWDADAEWIWPRLTPLNAIEYWYPNNHDLELFDLLIDDSAVDWLGTADGTSWLPHTYSATTHTYRYDYIGTGAGLQFRIADHEPYGSDMTADNVGMLTVSITPVPEPASLSLLMLGAVGLLRRRVNPMVNSRL
ncbi:MAG: PEP-CTERM sorting domain-containing protein [Phycisphaerae bacterium]